MSGVSVRTLPAAAGIAWLRGAFRLLGRQPIPMVMLTALGPLLSLSLALVPLLGQGLGLLLFPMILLGMLSVCRTADQGAVPGISSYAAGLRDPAARLRLLQIGVCYALVVGLVGLAWTLVPEEADTRPTKPSGAAVQAPGAAQRAAPPAPTASTVPAVPPAEPPLPGATPETAPGAAPGAPAAGRSSPPAADAGPASAEEAPSLALTPARMFVVLATLLISIPLQITVLFATTLVAWHGLPSIKALFFGFFAGWRNRTPILVNLFGLFGLAFVAMLALAALIALLGLSEETAQVLLGPVILLLLPIGAASSYAMVRDVLAQSDAQAPAPAVPPAGS